MRDDDDVVVVDDDITISGYINLFRSSFNNNLIIIFFSIDLSLLSLSLSR